MKKVLLFAALMFVAVPSLKAQTSEASANVTARVIAVPDRVTVTVTSGADLLFENLVPGIDSTKLITVNVIAEADAPWVLKFNGTSFNGAPVLPAGSIQYNLTGEGQGVYTPPSDFIDVPVDPTIAYVSSPAEGSVTNMKFTFKIKINIPATLPPGDYRKFLHFTLQTL